MLSRRGPADSIDSRCTPAYALRQHVATRLGRHFALVHMERLPHIGSDHFPVYVVLQTGKVFEQIQEELVQADADEQEAQQAIQEGIEKAEREAERQKRAAAKDDVFGGLLKDVGRTVGRQMTSQLGRNITRTILGAFFGKKR